MELNYRLLEQVNLFTENSTYMYAFLKILKDKTYLYMFHKHINYFDFN